MPRVKVILNPNSGKGHGAELRPEIERLLTSLGVDHDLVQTTHAGHAITLAQDAVDQGYDTLVAVGGDGTTHEVVNGMLSRATSLPTGILGCIPAGSGNDFAVMNGISTNVQSACETIAAGRTKTVDIGRVRVDGQVERYFDNAVGSGFDAQVTVETYRMKNLLRGVPLYLAAVLKATFFSLRMPHIEVTVDGQGQELDAVMALVCNGPREGGAFHMAPPARFDDGLFDLVLARKISRPAILALVPRFMKSTHMSHPALSTVQGRDIRIRSSEAMVYHVDGEILGGPAHDIRVEMLPGALRMITAS